MQIVGNAVSTTRSTSIPRMLQQRPTGVSEYSSTSANTSTMPLHRWPSPVSHAPMRCAATGSLTPSSPLPNLVPKTGTSGPLLAGSLMQQAGTYLPAGGGPLSAGPMLHKSNVCCVPVSITSLEGHAPHVNSSRTAPRGRSLSPQHHGQSGAWVTGPTHDKTGQMSTNHVCGAKVPYSSIAPAGTPIAGVHRTQSFCARAKLAEGNAAVGTRIRHVSPAQRSQGGQATRVGVNKEGLRVRSCSPEHPRNTVLSMQAASVAAPSEALLVNSMHNMVLDVQSNGRTHSALNGTMATNSKDPEKLQPGVEVSIGEHRFRCLDMLGSGSYSVVWRAEVISNPQLGKNGRELETSEVALKDVFCKSHSSLRQSLFEVQLLLALERRVLLDRAPSPQYPLRLPRCFSYSVETYEEGWCVRTAMTRLPGEQLDDWLKDAADVVVAAVTAGAPSDNSLTWIYQLQRGCVMAGLFIRQLGPTLETLTPLAWHRDVNSHNVLVSDVMDNGSLQTSDSGSRASFWLCDLGLAVDSRSWVGEQGAWRVTDIGGDCRYWPASSWMVHLYGADYLLAREEYCQQYQTRLDSHGLGITAVEILCSTALAARRAGAAPVECPADDTCWLRLLDAWHLYDELENQWWEAIYSVFCAGGDFGPVHSWLVQETVSDKVIALLSELQQALRGCICRADPESRTVLHALAELIDESSNLELRDVCALLEGRAQTDSPTEQRADQRDTETLIAGLNPAAPSGASRRGAEDAVSNGLDSNSGHFQRKTEEASNALTTGASKVVPGIDDAVGTSAAKGVQNPSVQDSVALVAAAAAAAEEGRQALEGLQPCPAIAVNLPLERGRPVSGRSRQVELAELKEAQGRLRHDLERLQLAKLRLQYARRLHEARQAPPTIAASPSRRRSLSRGRTRQ